MAMKNFLQILNHQTSFLTSENFKNYDFIIKSLLNLKV